MKYLSICISSDLLCRFNQVVDEKAIRKAGQWDIYAEIYSPYVPPASVMPFAMQVNLAAALHGDSVLAAVAQDPEFPSWVGGYSTHDSHFESDPEGVSPNLLTTA